MKKLKIQAILVRFLFLGLFEERANLLKVNEIFKQRYKQAILIPRKRNRNDWSAIARLKGRVWAWRFYNKNTIKPPSIERYHVFIDAKQRWAGSRQSVPKGLSDPNFATSL